MFRFKIAFQYADEMSKGEWRNQSCSLCASNEREAINKCIELYGLGYDCVYKILYVSKEN